MHLLLLLMLFLWPIQQHFASAAVLQKQQRTEEDPNLHDSASWGHLHTMPRHSYFAGFEPPDDALRWSKAVASAATGRQLLLRKVLETIRCPGDLLTGEKKFKWIHRIADVFVNRNSGFEEPLKNFTGYRAPITMIGYKLFDRKNWEGSELRAYTYIPKILLENLRRGKENFPRKFVAIGNMDENW